MKPISKSKFSRLLEEHNQGKRGEFYELMYKELTVSIDEFMQEIHFVHPLTAIDETHKVLLTLLFNSSITFEEYEEKTEKIYKSADSSFENLIQNIFTVLNGVLEF